MVIRSICFNIQLEKSQSLFSTFLWQHYWWRAGATLQAGPTQGDQHKGMWAAGLNSLMLDLYALAGLEQYCSEILCAQTPLFNISAPSMSYSCYGDISALQAPTISCTPVRASDCGMYHSLLELSTFVLDREMPYLLLLQNWCGVAIQWAKREKVTLPLPKQQMKPPDLMGSGRTNFMSHGQDLQPQSKGK